MTQIRALVRPYVNATRRRASYGRAALRSRLPRLAGPPTTPAFVFILGCGRSGTTLLGDLVRTHSAVTYLFEPFALWAAVDPRTDVGHKYTDVATDIVLDENDWSPEIQSRFDRLFAGAGDGQPLVIEKSPRNTMRIGYLQRLAVGCRFVHIVRSGPDVARSIAGFAERNVDDSGRQRRQANGWWGIDDAKWNALCQGAARIGGMPADMSNYRDNHVRGACEWIMSLDAIAQRKTSLGDDLLEVRYEDLTASPEETLREIAGFLELDWAPAWAEQAVKMVRLPRPVELAPLLLPGVLAGRLNAWQERYGFEERAVEELDRP